MRSRYELDRGKHCLRVEFEEAGERLDLHDHFHGNFHDTEVLTGSILAWGPRGPWAQQVDASGGMVYENWQNHHEIIAMLAGTIILNTYREPLKNFDKLLAMGWITGGSNG